MERLWLPETEGRLTLLLCLDRTAPATREQLVEFIMTCGLMNYFDLCSNLEDLVKTRHITERNDRAGVLLSLSETGERTLAFFADRVPQSRRERILAEAPAWQARFRREQDAPAALVTREGQPTEMHLLAPEDCAPLLRALFVLRGAPPDDWRTRWQQAAPILAHETAAMLDTAQREAGSLPEGTSVEPFALPAVLLTLTEGDLTLTLRRPDEASARRLASAWPSVRTAVAALWHQAMGMAEN
ncbi:MAG: DUF4364 family protein [Clostridia bacterium]|nr:DUF4364 family protein [Clostridia bacterium]